MIDPLYDARKDVIGQIGRHHGNVFGCSCMAHQLRAERPPSMLCINITRVFQNEQRLAHGLAAHTVSPGEFILRGQFVPRPQFSAYDLLL